MVAHYNDKVHGQSGSIVLKISWIRHLGAMQAQPELCGCTGVTWDVTGIGTGAFLWTAGVAGTVGAWFVWVASVAGAVGVGCRCYAGGGSAGCATEKQYLVGACSVGVVLLGTVWTALTLHSQRCLNMQQYVEPLLVHTW